MKEPLYFRKQIPFFHDKTEKEIQQDPYERYDSMVIRQSVLHLADDLWNRYPMQAVIDFAQPHLPEGRIESILEIGCSVGRWIANLAKAYPNAKCWGIDYSYQMLKQAQEIWIEENAIRINISKYGFSSNYQLKALQLKNLHFGLAKGTALPFSDQSQDLVLSSFLIDRLDDPISGLREMKRVLRSEGKMIFVTPLNFNRPKHWDELYPPVKIYQALIQMGFEILDWKEEIIIDEPLDKHGNVVRWNCIGVVCQVKQV